MGRAYEEVAEIVEPFGLTEVYCTGVARAFASFGHVHITYCVDAMGEAGLERVANLKLVIPVEVLTEARRMVDAAVKAAQRRLDA